MSRIIQLDSFIYNRIAAGEVVNRPASVVKELLENSIDANASRIEIAIKGGGIQSIYVSDNGTGMSADDAELAFLPHATSKIKTLDDLNKIMTLGFRGEALPSIAAVSDVHLVTKTADDELGYFIEINNGNKIQSGVTGCATGTTITVKDLFLNIPARQKFLDSVNKEQALIISTIENFILANYNISINFECESKSISSFGQGLESALLSVYGKNILDNLVKAQCEKNGIKVYGYISKPGFVKSNRNNQTLIVNGRVVENSEISFMIHNCYYGYLVKRQYPMYVLYVELPADMIDVNVHPNKTEVKFADLNQIKSIIAQAVKSAININLNAAKEISLDSFTIKQYCPKTESQAQNQIQSQQQNIKPENKPLIDLKRPSPNTALNSPSSFSSVLSSFIKTQIKQQEFANEIKSETKIAGKLFNTYVILEYENNAYFIDQHAAHEKLLYDKLCREYQQNKFIMQDLLAPYVFDVSNEDKILIENNLSVISDCGFVIEPLNDNYFKLLSLPMIVSNLNFVNFVSDLTALLRNNHDKPEYVSEQIMQNACKHAVKGEMDLSRDDILNILSQMQKENTALFCPHGRPITVLISKREIEKWFVRIV